MAIQATAFGQFPAPAVTAALNVERTTVYENETFPVTLSIVSVGERLGRTMNLLSMPPRETLELGAFEELPAERSREQRALRETRRFRCRARAGNAGVVTIAPILQVTTVPWNRRYDVRVQPVELRILPLPAEGRPDAFSGAVGQFSMEVDVSPRDVAPGDIVKVLVTVSGRGRLDGVTAPRMDAGRGFKVYEPSRMATGKKDTVVFEQVLIPQTTNATPVPRVMFTYFDPALPGYGVLEAGPFPLAFRERAVPVSPAPIFTAPTAATSAPVGRREPGPAPASRLDPAMRKRMAALLAFWVVAAALALLAARRFKRSVAPWAVVAVALVAVLAFPSFRRMTGQRFGAGPTASVVTEDQARLAPSKAALATFDLAPGSPVTVLETYGEWVKIAAGKNRGWVPGTAIEAAGERTD